MPLSASLKLFDKQTIYINPHRKFFDLGIVREIVQMEENYHEKILQSIEFLRNFQIIWNYFWTHLFIIEDKKY